MGEQPSIPARGPEDPEHARLTEAREAGTEWRKWGPYLSERQWGTVREDYSQDGNAWAYFGHDQARSRAYHWGEDGLAGISDNILFYEYFHGDNGAGLGASHQTGWTGLVGPLIELFGKVDAKTYLEIGKTSVVQGV
jgi:hypothetical protein